MVPSSVVASSDWILRTEQLLNSWDELLSVPLIERRSPSEDAVAIAQAPFVVVSHGGESDPLLNYANNTALQLWKMTLEEFLRTPSRYTAEPVHREERSELLARTTRDGYIDDYSGIRISADGERFRIHQAVVWNVRDAEGNPAGQAATFAEWTPLGKQ